MHDLDRTKLRATTFVGSLAVSLLLACGDSADDMNMNAPGAGSGAAAGAGAPGGSGVAGSSAAGRTGTAGSSATGQAGQSGGPAAGTGSSAGMSAAGASGGAAGEAAQGGSAGAAGSGEMADCTPIQWDNPRSVPNPKVVFAGDDDGKLFEQKEGMAEFDYEMKEYFFTGTSPAYTTRMVVRRPRDPAKFSGTVFAEWYNVSGGIDFAVMWADSREYFMREGHVFVGISAQQVGADALKSTEQIAERYKSINHPGDQAADAIFSQAGVALRTQSETLLGPCMPVRTLLAIGQSQSAARLTSYVNSSHASAQVFDGFLLHSGGEPSSSDPGVPVFVVLTMTEGNGSRDDGPNLVKWNVAGATHNGERVTSRGAEAASLIGLEAGDITKCRNPLNRYPSFRVYNAALDSLLRWVRDGKKPPAGSSFEMSGSALALDANKNVLGGVRIADIDVPIATYDLDNGPTDPLNVIGYLACGLGGNTVYFDEAKLLELYPTHEDYVTKYTAAADKALAAGYLLQADRDDAIKQAQSAAIPK